VIAGNTGPVAVAPAAEPHSLAITSPLVGIFHASVATGDTHATRPIHRAVEALGMPTSVDAPQSGTVEELLVHDGSPVEYGQPLLIPAPLQSLRRRAMSEALLRFFAVSALDARLFGRRARAAHRGVLEADPVLQDVWLRGEVVNVSRSPAGHYYFSLKEETTPAALRALQGQRLNSPVMPANGPGGGSPTARSICTSARAAASSSPTSSFQKRRPGPDAGRTPVPPAEIRRTVRAESQTAAAPVSASDWHRSRPNAARLSTTC